MTLIGHYLGSGFLILGGFLVLVSSLGMLRFPDLFTRIHASSVATTLGAICIVVGLMFYNGADSVMFKLVLILFFLLFTGPTSTHALARAALEAGLKPSFCDRKETDSAGSSIPKNDDSHHSKKDKNTEEGGPSSY